MISLDIKRSLIPASSQITVWYCKGSGASSRLSLYTFCLVHSLLPFSIRHCPSSFTGTLAIMVDSRNSSFNMNMSFFMAPFEFILIKISTTHWICVVDFDMHDFFEKKVKEFNLLSKNVLLQ